MAELTIKYSEYSSAPSVLVNGELSDHLLRQFVWDELRPLGAGQHFLRQVQTLARSPNFDYGFGNAIALSVEEGNAILEHVVASIPSYSLPLSVLLDIAQCWCEAQATPPHKFQSRTFSVP